MTGEGLRMLSTGEFVGGKSTKAADIELREQFARSCSTSAARYVGDLKKFVADNLPAYPLIRDSSCAPAARERAQMREQTNPNAFVVP